MRLATYLATVTAVLFATTGVAQRSSSGPLIGPQHVNLWRFQKASAISAKAKAGSKLNVQSDRGFEVVNVDGPDYSEFPEQWFEQPLDHFDKKNGHTFKQRYWVSERHYKKGGPVIVLDGGETSGEDRLPFLDTGIVDILAKATGGLGVVLEHRYYGGSIPVLNFSTDSLRWLNNAQSAADSANFMASVKFNGIREDLTAPKTPWIYYGGSYAGARAAHMRILYPDLVFGAIASSGVTHAALVNWEYHDIIRRAADPECSRRLQEAVHAIDYALGLPHLRKFVKGLFGLAELEHNDDFASVIESPLGAWQGKNWDPEVGSTRFDEFCDALKKPVLRHELEAFSKQVAGASIPVTVYNYGKYIKENIVANCPEGNTVEDCFGTYGDPAEFRYTELSQTWRAWTFQVCTEWGYFSSAPLDPKIPRIVSRFVNLATSSRICPLAFPPGKHFAIPSLPNVTVVNELGDFDIAADRLAIIDGEVDPWRPDTPHSEYAKDREDTVLRPFKLIPNGVHHYDEYGLRDIRAEPPEILKIHKEMISFVKAWLEDAKARQENELEKRDIPLCC